VSQTQTTAPGSVRFVVAPREAADLAAATEWARRLGAPLVGARWDARDLERDVPSSVVLEVGAAGLALVGPAGERVTAADGRLGGHPLPGRDALARAALTRRPEGPPTVIDATAGLGADGFHLAALGHEVTLLEREPLFAALLADTLARAGAGEFGEAARAAAGRATLVQVDARAYLAATGPVVEVVYLDPMFPRTGGAALPGKGMAAFRTALAVEPQPGAEEEAELLSAARARATRRVIVKRPVRAAPLGGVAPSGSLGGRTVRYDLYAPSRRPG